MRSDAQPIRMRRCAAQPSRVRPTAHSVIRSRAQRCAAGDTIKNQPLRERIPAFWGRYCAPFGPGAADLPATIRAAPGPYSPSGLETGAGISTPFASLKSAPIKGLREAGTTR